MFIVSPDEAAAIRSALARGGEWVAVAELRRHFPSITDNAAALRAVQMIAGWGGPAVRSASDAPTPTR